MSEAPKKKIVIKAPSPAEYRAYLERVRATATEDPQPAPETGDKMPDGTIFVGTSPDTGRHMYAAPADAPLTMDFNAAAEYASELAVGDKKDFRVPTKGELDLLFDNREKGALKGTFNAIGFFPDGFYWSSTSDAGGVDCAKYQCFSEEDHFYLGFAVKGRRLSVRCVRG